MFIDYVSIFLLTTSIPCPSQWRILFSYLLIVGPYTLHFNSIAFRLEALYPTSATPTSMSLFSHLFLSLLRWYFSGMLRLKNVVTSGFESKYILGTENNLWTELNNLKNAFFYICKMTNWEIFVIFPHWKFVFFPCRPFLSNQRLTGTKAISK